MRLKEESCFNDQMKSSFAAVFAVNTQNGRDMSFRHLMGRTASSSKDWWQAIIEDTCRQAAEFVSFR